MGNRKAYGSLRIARPGETHFLGAESASSPYQKAINDGFSERFAGGNRFRLIHPRGAKMRARVSQAFRRDREYKASNIALFL